MVTEPGANRLLRVLEFVNTLDVETSADGVRGWLGEQGIRRPTRAQVEHATTVREAVRALLLANNGAATDVTRAQATLGDAARRGRLRVRFDDGVRLEPAATGLDGVLGHLVAAVVVATADGSFGRAKACRAPDCRWAFYDRARNRSRTWCSMAVCGNRAKARAHRARESRR